MIDKRYINAVLTLLQIFQLKLVNEIFAGLCKSVSCILQECVFMEISYEECT